MREDDSPQFRSRCLMLLLMNDGKNYDQIAEFLGCSRRTVAHWCNRGEPENLASLRDGREQGNHRKATEAYMSISTLTGTYTTRNSAWVPKRDLSPDRFLW